MNFGVDSETGVLRDVLLCRPQYYEWLATSDIARDSIARRKKFDREKALKQHATLVDALEFAAVECHFIEPVAGQHYHTTFFGNSKKEINYIQASPLA